MQMKRRNAMTAILLAVAMMLSLAACGNGEEAADGAKTQAATAAASFDGKNTGKTLVLYFSANNRKDTDTVSSATPMAEDLSSVAWIATAIHDKVGGDLAQIVPARDYPVGYDALADAAKEEADNDARPAIEPLEVDPSSYDTVFLGYPIWWYGMPMVLETLFDTYDFSGVTIIPFNTHAGSSDGGTYDDIRQREPEATVLEGLAVRGEDAGKNSAKTSVEEWLATLDL